MKINLPVILLKGIILLPNNDLRLEFDQDVSKNLVEVSELFHDNLIFVVSQTDPLEEKPERKELPTIGVVAKISHKMELPNGKTRVIITGLYRGKALEYLNLNHSSEVLESIISEIPEEKITEKEEIAFIRKIYRELELYIKNIPYMSNSVLSQINENQHLSKVTDIVVPNLPVSLERLQEYLYTVSTVSRASMILSDIYQESELFAIEKKLDYKVREQLDNTQREFLLREKIKMMKEELGEVSTKDDEIGEITEKIETLNAPRFIKERLQSELKRYETLSQMSPEMNLVRNYIDWLLDLPWTSTTIDNEDLKQVKQELDNSHNGLEKIKSRIIEYLAVKQMTNSLRSPILCFVGPPGVGKTSLAISIASSIKREFVKMSVGGVNDEAEILGHRRTYLGAAPGRIIQAMKKAKTNNPVFLIDEIDKMTKDIKGDPASALLSVLDPEQNTHFSDNYIEEEYDLSNVMFIATANYIEDIPDALRDRLEIIQLSGYTEFEKVDISLKHLIPKEMKEHGLEPGKVEFLPDALLEMIRGYTKEAGVRELERSIATVIRKIVTSIVVNNIKVNQLYITPNNIEEYLGKKKYRTHSSLKGSKVGVVNGLAYTYYGGDTLPIEVSFFPGKGELELTGSLGEVMKESAHIAFSYIKANADYYHINYELLQENDIHIHIPDGAVPKDGPSAGITLTTALISALSNKKMDASVAMTGEMTLRGKILPIGGLKEKSIGAYRSGIRTIIIPFDNMNDLEEIPKEIKNSISYIPVKNYKEVLQHIVKE